MRARVQNGWLLGVAMLLALPAMAQTPAPDAKSPPAQAAPAAGTATPAAPAPAAPATDPFAFPEEDSKTKSLGEEPAPAAPDVPAAPVPAVPAPSAPDAPAPAADSHPYPGDAAPAGGGFSSSSDNAAGSPDAGTLPDATVRKKLELHDEGSTGQIDTARADKDYQVADYYIKDGNYAGAYLRYKDAVTYDPDNADAHFRLAEMARKLGKTAEATSEYNAALKLDPQSKNAKAARKALAELQPAAQK